jgi:probable F420-dependent oxidoreductase
MRLSLHLPIDIDDREFQNGAAAREMAQAVERAGVDACWITDHPAPTTKWRRAGGHDAIDPFAGLAFVAAATTRLRLHTHIVVLPYRNPFLTAKSVATVDALSDGRMILGVGVGYMRGEYAALGVEFEARGALTDEALQTMKLAWSGESVVREAATFNAVGNLPRPLPVQQPHPPIWVGGNSERALRRAAEQCDGWAPFFASGALAATTRTDELVGLEDLKVKIDVLQDHLARVGRTRPFDICGQPPVGFKDCTPAEAQAFVDFAGGLGELGVNWLVAGVPHPSRSAYVDNVQWLSEEVLPKVRGLGRTDWSGDA